MQFDELAYLIQTHLKPRMRDLASCETVAELEAHLAYQETQSILQTVLNTAQAGDFRVRDLPTRERYRILTWNIERGKELLRQIDALRTHPGLSDCDVLLLVETDIGMARSGNVDVARTMAAKLGMCYAFTPCYLSLVKGSGSERDAPGENDLGLHGNSILSRYPLSALQVIPLENGIDKFASSEKRLGRQTALAARVELPGCPLTAVCTHLDANSTQRHRAEQMRTILDALPAAGPVLLGGDWNTTTFDSSTAFRAIMGYWLRVMMGPDNVIRNHYLHPYRRFEKELFQLIEDRGYEYRRSNVIGEGTVFYDVDDLRTYKGLAEWVPQWCFPFIRWALRNHGGRCPLKLDWFASRGLEVESPHVIHELGLSDHEAISVEIVTRKSVGYHE